MSRKRILAETCQRISVPDAAKEIGCDPDYLRQKMKRKEWDLGVVVPPVKGKKMYTYFIFRAKLDRFLGIENGGISNAKS